MVWVRNTMAYSAFLILSMYQLTSGFGIRKSDKSDLLEQVSSIISTLKCEELASSGISKKLAGLRAKQTLSLMSEFSSRSTWYFRIGLSLS